MAGELRTGFCAGLRKATGGYLGYVEQLRWRFAGGGKGIAKHGVAEGAGGAYCLRSGGHELGGAVVADALAGLFAEKGQTSAGSAAEAAFAVAGCFDQGSGERRNGAGFIVDIAVAAQVAGIVEDD